MLTIPKQGNAKVDPATVEVMRLDPAAVEGRCWHCHLPVRHPAIAWFPADGSGEPVYLHGQCAGDLVRMLRQDVERLRGVSSLEEFRGW